MGSYAQLAGGRFSGRYFFTGYVRGNVRGEFRDEMLAEFLFGKFRGFFTREMLRICEGTVWCGCPCRGNDSCIQNVRLSHF